MTDKKIQNLIEQYKEKLSFKEEALEKNNIILDMAFFNDALSEGEYEDLCNTVETEYKEIEELKEKIERLEELLETENYSSFYKEFQFEIWKEIYDSNYL